MKVLKILLLFLCIPVLCWNIGCQSNQSRPSTEILNLELLRGDIVLCGGNQFGEVNFFISNDESVRDTFNLAVSLLHSFEYDEAKKAFSTVIDKDPECVMAYWGLAMSYLGHPKFALVPDDFKKGSEVLKIAEPLPKTRREQDYLEAIGAYFKDDLEKSDHKTRALRMEQKMEEVYKKYNDDKEAAIFYALSLFATDDPTDKKYTKQKKAGAILESIFPKQPNHPGIAHYIIHHYDSPELAQLALPTARRYADIAPASAHAQHMPSHIFTRLGLWDESIQSNVNSASSAQCYAEETEMDGHWHNEIHAMDYLVYAYLQKGDNAKANEVYEHLKTMKKEYPSSSSPYNFAAIPVRIALENKQWAKAADLRFHESEHQWEKFPWEESMLHFARSLGASHINDIHSAEEALGILRSLQQGLVQKGDKYKADQVMIQVIASEAWIDFAKSNYDEALALMQEAAKLEDKTGKHPVTPGEVMPASELLGDMLLAMNKSPEALRAYEQSLKARPNRFNAIYGAALAAKGIGDEKKATMYFEKLLKLTELSKCDRPELKEAREFVGQKLI
jgi:tetratricopeptide (TPR) repeat protein